MFHFPFVETFPPSIFFKCITNVKLLKSVLYMLANGIQALSLENT